VVRDDHAHRAAFAREVGYLQHDARGLAAGEPWPVDLGPELSRGFRALKVWMTLKTYGADRIGQVAEHCCALAQLLSAPIDTEPLLERAAALPLNVVCFRFVPGDNAMQAEIAADLQEAGGVVLSTTSIRGQIVLRAAFVNHRTDEADIAEVIQSVISAGCRRAGIFSPSVAI
jgi:glutamate/tyrosine decarboxylase-like PLP-dependent enzyme